MPLFSELQACKFGAISTTRPHKEFPRVLKELKDRFSTKLKQNTLLGAIVQKTLCLAQQDNNVILALSNVYTINQAKDFREKVKKRPTKTLTNSRIVRRVFGDNHKKELQIPCFIDDYNYYIGGVNLANQFRELYETYRLTFKTWWPLFYQLIDIAYVNLYKLYRLHTTDKPFTHLQFRTKLYCKLLGYSTKAKLQSLQVELGGKRVFNLDLQYLHYQEKRYKGTCVWCLYKLRY